MTFPRDRDTDEAAQRRCEDGVAVEAGASMARITRLVAAIKAERESGVHAAVRDAGESERLADADRERRLAEETIAALRAELDEVRAAAEAARARHEEAAIQQQRAMADLELLHEHQRSIWQLDRRRLEITIAGQEAVQRKRGSRTAVAAALLVAGLVGLALLGDRLSSVDAVLGDRAGDFSASGSSR